MCVGVIVLVLYSIAFGARTASMDSCYTVLTASVLRSGSCSSRQQECLGPTFEELVASQAVATTRAPKVLVTGAAGFIGSHVAEFCAHRLHFQVVAVDDLSGGFERNVGPVLELGGIFVKGDVGDDEFVRNLFAEHGPFDYVYHLAAYAAGGLSHFIRRYNYGNNLLASATLLNAAVRQQPMVTRFVFTSSIAAFGAADPTELPMTECTPQRPEDPYGIAKHSFELDLKAAEHMFGLNWTVFRPHNVYGPRQNIADKFRNAVGIFMNQILQGEPITIFGDGQQTRAFSYIDDVAPLIAGSVLFLNASCQDFFVGVDDPWSVNDLALQVVSAMKADGHPIVHLDSRKEVVDAYASHDKLRCLFRPPVPTSLPVGLLRTANFVKQQGASEPTGYVKIEVKQNLPPSWSAWLGNEGGLVCQTDECRNDRCPGDATPGACSNIPNPIGMPRVLLVIPGFGGMEARRDTILANLNIIRKQPIELICILYVYQPRAIDTANAEQFKPCQIVEAKGAWSDFAATVPHEQISQADVVALAADDVLISPDKLVDLVQIIKIMRWNCVDMIAPSCVGSSHRSMNPVVNKEGIVGRRVHAIEIQFTVFTGATFRCFQDLLRLGFNFSPSHASTLFEFFVHSFCNASLGMVDSMQVVHNVQTTGLLQEQFKNIEQSGDAVGRAANMSAYLASLGATAVPFESFAGSGCGILRDPM